MHDPAFIYFFLHNNNLIFDDGINVIHFYSTRWQCLIHNYEVTRANVSLVSIYSQIITYKINIVSTLGKQTNCVDFQLVLKNGASYVGSTLIR